MVRPSKPSVEDGASFLLGGGPASPGGPGGRTRRQGWGVFLAVLLLVVLGVAVSVYFLQQGADVEGQPGPVDLPPVRTDYCTATPATATAGGQFAELDPEQAGNAAIIAAVARRRGLPVRAATIGIATALQESGLRNVTYGDRDSLGLFQQRPSQGWGTRKQITDPVYAANAFYDALVKVRGYRTMSVTKAAQKVQRSAFPDAYAAYGPSAATIAAVLGGRPSGGFTCVLDAGSETPQTVVRKGVTRRTAAMRAAAAKETGVRSTRVLTSTTIRFRVPASTGNRRVWALAEWAVARASDLDIVEVRVAGRVWDRAKSTDGWTKTAGKPAIGVVIRVG